MKTIKLSGRETAVLRAIGFSLGMPGSEIIEHTQIPVSDLVDVLNGLLDVGYVQTEPPLDRVNADLLGSTNFEVNPSYAKDLREVSRRFY
jgi:DNA-binding IclR family transcriptional regulator